MEGQAAGLSVHTDGFGVGLGGQPGFHLRSSASYLCTLSEHFISLLLGCIIMEKSLCPSQDRGEHCSYSALGAASGTV